jgi:hypothetical protein
MRTLEIRKKSLKTWLHIDNIAGDFIISKFYFNSDINQFQIVEQGQSKRYIYDVLNITVYDDTVSGTPETFATITELSLRLEALKYPAFFNEGQSLIEAFTDLTDTPNSYTGEAGRIVKVKDGEDGLEFGDASGFNLQVYEEGDTPITNVNEIEVIGATVTNDGGGKVTLEVTGGGATPTLPQVLAQGNRVLKEQFDFPYIFVPEDIGTIVYGYLLGGYQLDFGLFNINDELIFISGGAETVTGLGGVEFQVGISSATSFDVDTYEVVHLRKINATSWAVSKEMNGTFTGGGAVDSVNGQTGVVVLDADDIAETATRFWLTTALKSNYDSAYTWVNTNGATVLSFISNIATTIRGTLLTGLSTATGGTILATDTMLQAFGKAQHQIDNRVMVLLNDTTSSSSLTGTTTETQIGSSILIPANTFVSGETFTIDVQFNRNATAISTCIFRVRINTVNTFAGSTFLATAASGTTNFSCPIIRTACFKSATTLEILNINQSLNNDTTANSPLQASTVTFDTTIDNYLFLSGQLFNVLDSFYLSRVSINKRKLKTTI